MESAKVQEKSGLSEVVKRRYNGLMEEFAEDFEKLVGYAVEHAVDAKQFAVLMMPLLRKSMVWIDPGKVEAVSVELGRWDEVVVKLKMPSCEVQLSRHGAEVLIPSIYVEQG